jgi:NAD(P)-dependent dehydrogenase (short-subunit alcohol dehydrogenase family)
MTDTGMSLDGKRVVAIGGASGIGFAVAELARAQGAAVVIGSSTEANVNAAVERLPGATGRTVDLRDEASVAGFFGALGGFDHLAITAGDWGGSMFFASSRDLDLEAARELLEVRFWGVLAAVKHGCRTIAQNGSITLTSGMLTHRPRKGAPLSTALGGAAEYLARGLAMDLMPVRVNAVCPGIVLTDHVKQTMPEAMLQSIVAPLSVPRGAAPAKAAKAYVYLMLNGYATGQILPVDGGGLMVSPRAKTALIRTGSKQPLAPHKQPSKPGELKRAGPPFRGRRARPRDYRSTACGSLSLFATRIASK